jgi:hypothetical protein
MTSLPAARFAEDTLALEAEAIDNVALTARLHAERLPAASPWQGYFEELATSLTEDAARLRLVANVGSDPALQP